MQLKLKSRGCIVLSKVKTRPVARTPANIYHEEFCNIS